MGSTIRFFSAENVKSLILTVFEENVRSKGSLGRQDLNWKFIKTDQQCPQTSTYGRPWKLQSIEEITTLQVEDLADNYDPLFRLTGKILRERLEKPCSNNTEVTQSIVPQRHS
ncbi:hypothetical protein PoB_006919200 [Plakobranchus ocellatus]|uniref:Uncharacterized protein n=1 Tax=Plakobranchus ocellatus TaxID=259542 RepID=A0AAV4DEL2_9GAST|nr:hypothetical protein PoB_006919200 [Plakobranchus ocellatus]